MHCYLYFFSVLLALKGERLQSNLRVTDAEGNDAGPRIELNATVLKTDDVLYYICRQDQNKPENFLVKYVPGVGNIKVETVLKEDVRACSPNDVNYTCTVTSGTIVWNKESAGVCHCQAFPREIYLVYWINPRWSLSSTSASRVINLNVEDVGKEVKMSCILDIYPNNFLFIGLITPNWTFSRLDANNDYKTEEMPVGVSVFLANHGPLVTAAIHEFLPCVHAGRYVCNGQFYPYSGHIEPTVFDIHVRPHVILINSLNDDFKFVLNGTVKFTCIAWSYPPPLNMSMYVGTAPLTNESIGVTTHTETRSRTVGEIMIEVTVFDLSEVFGNESTLSCTSVWSRNGFKQTVNKRVMVSNQQNPVIALMSKKEAVKVQGDGVTESYNNQTAQTLSSSTRFKENHHASSLALFLIVALIVFFGLFLPMLAVFLALHYRIEKKKFAKEMEKVPEKEKSKTSSKIATFKSSQRRLRSDSQSIGDALDGWVKLRTAKLGTEARSSRVNSRVAVPRSNRPTLTCFSAENDLRMDQEATRSMAKMLKEKIEQDTQLIKAIVEWKKAKWEMHDTKEGQHSPRRRRLSSWEKKTNRSFHSKIGAKQSSPYKLPIMATNQTPPTGSKEVDVIPTLTYTSSKLNPRRNSDYPLNV